MKPLEHGATKAMTRDGRVVENLLEYENGFCGYVDNKFEYWNSNGTYVRYFESPLDLFAYEETTMKKQIPFELERALAGAQVVTRGGKRLERDDWHWFKNSKSFWCIRTDNDIYTKNGNFSASGVENDLDLMLEVDVEKVERWVNVYPSENQIANLCNGGISLKTGQDIFRTKEFAKAFAISDCIGQAFISIEVEK